jgi:anti-sigma regulatory factor (Ser/Thr protein kinase)
VDLTSTDSIRLSVPATSASVRIARAGAAGLATRAGFTYREVEQITLAVGEAAAVLTREHGDAGTLTLLFDIDADALRIDLRLEPAAEPLAAPAGPGPATAEPIGPIALAVLDGGVDTWQIGDEGRRLVLRRRLPEADLDDDD